jgi:DNA-directed RNA polymerase I, II, and III subunit RPABC2
VDTEIYGTEDPDVKRPREDIANGDYSIAVSGTVDEAIRAKQDKKGASSAWIVKDKILDDKRSTTPYMTKYERARVLETRALYIN